jgi:hypothetical protein
MKKGRPTREVWVSFYFGLDFSGTKKRRAGYDPRLGLNSEGGENEEKRG